MTETARPRTAEFYNPRPMILGVCFFWGIAMGFGLNFFRTPEETEGPAAMPPAAAGAAAATDETPARLRDVPAIAPVEPLPATAASRKETLENLSIDPPSAILNTVGDLSSKTAMPIGSAAAEPPPASAPGAAQPSGPPRMAPPPIPELAPR